METLSLVVRLTQLNSRSSSSVDVCFFAARASTSTELTELRPPFWIYVLDGLLCNLAKGVFPTATTHSFAVGERSWKLAIGRIAMYQLSR